eukprot:366038-Chlamydomonas_euryale.AAC.5
METFWKSSRGRMKMPGKCATSGDSGHTSPPRRRPNGNCPLGRTGRIAQWAPPFHWSSTLGSGGMDPRIGLTPFHWARIERDVGRQHRTIGVRSAPQDPVRVLTDRNCPPPPTRGSRQYEARSAGMNVRLALRPVQCHHAQRPNRIPRRRECLCAADKHSRSKWWKEQTTWLHELPHAWDASAGALAYRTITHYFCTAS